MTNIIIECYCSVSNVLFEKSILCGHVCSVYGACQVGFVIRENPKITNTLSETRRTFPIGTRRKVELIYVFSHTKRYLGLPLQGVIK